MTEHSVNSGGDFIAVNGAFVDIDLRSQSELAQRLEQARFRSVTLIRASQGEHGLPDPIDKAFLEAPRLNDGEIVPQYYASVDLSVEAVSSYKGSEQPWSQTMLEQLSRAFVVADYQVDELPHDINTLHVRLDTNHALSVKLTTSIDEVSLELELESVDDLETWIGTMSDLGSAESSDPVTVVGHVARCLGVSIDTAIAVLKGEDAEEVPRHLIELAPIPEQKSVKSIVPLGQTSNALAQIERQASGAPKREEMTYRPRRLETLPGAHTPRRRLLDIARAFNDRTARAIYQLPTTHFVLYGPPGVGKTTLVEAFAAETTAAMTVVTPDQYMTDYNVSASVTSLDSIFTEAEAKDGMQVLLFESIESIGQQTRVGSNMQRMLREAFIRKITELKELYPDILVAATMQAANTEIDQELIAPGILEPIAVPPPNQTERLEIISSIITPGTDFSIFTQQGLDQNDTEEPEDSYFYLYENDIDIDQIVAKTDGLSIRAIETLLERARYLAFQRYRASGEFGPTTKQDVLDAIATNNQ